MKKTIHFFTVIELMSVMVVIVILTAIAVPVIIGASAKGRETTARADMNSIKLALTQFKADYSVWPVVSPDTSLTSSGDLLLESPFDAEDNNDLQKKSIEAYDKMTQALTAQVVATEDLEKVNSTSSSSKYHYGNTKKRSYLDTVAKPVTFTTLTTDYTGYYKVDPWNRRYNIALDWNYNNRIDLDNDTGKKFARGTEVKPLAGQILIYSYGTAEAPDDTDGFLYSWKVIK